MPLTLITPPSTSPITLAEARLACRLSESDTAFDALLALLMPAAVDMVERWTGQALVSQSWRLTCDGFADRIDLPRGPVLAVDAVHYFDAAGMEQLLASSVYYANLLSEPARVMRKPNAAWPSTLNEANAVRVDFTCGYALMPGTLKLAMLGMVAELFDNGMDAPMPPGVMDRLYDFRPG